jgi:tetratricopeptide (TPR) repeat protein
MSWAALECGHCRGPATFGGAKRFPEGDWLYAVAWACASCGTHDLEICPLAPGVPRAGVCLNCGTARVASSCPGCGVGAGEIEGRVREALAGRPLSVDEARAVAGRGLYRLAFNMLDLHLIDHPDDSDAWAEKGRLAQTARLYGASIEWLQRAIESGGPARLLISLGCALHETERFDEAVAAYQRFLDGEDGEPEPDWVAAALTNQGNSWARLGDLERAIAVQRKAVEREPDRVVLHINLAHALRQQKAYQESVRVLDRALERAPPAERGRVLHLRADSLCELEQAEPALRDIDEALRDRPDDPSRNYVRGWALGMLGRLDEARACMLRVLELAPDDAAAQRGLKMIDGAMPPRPPPSAKRPWWKLW